MALLRRRDTLQLAAVGLSAAALGLGRYAWAGSAEAAGADAALTTVAPELRDAAIKVIAATRGFHPMGADRLPMLRAALATAKTPEGSAIPVRVERVPVGPGRPAVTVYVINERPGAVARPAILHTHGGGFVTGSALLELPGLIAIAGELDCVIVSVEYRLSPEVTWRESLAETWAALRWLYADAASLGVDPRRIAVFGESAGGGHAALLALRARDSGDVPHARRSYRDDPVPGAGVRHDRLGCRSQSVRLARLSWCRAGNGCGPRRSGADARREPARFAGDIYRCWRDRPFCARRHRLCATSECKRGAM